MARIIGAAIPWQQPSRGPDQRLTRCQAEHLERGQVMSWRTSSTLRPVLQEFVGECSDRSVTSNSTAMPTSTHGGSRQCLQAARSAKILADKLSLEVRKVDKLAHDGPRRCCRPVFKRISSPVAYRLSLQGRIARLTTNLLPPEITFGARFEPSRMRLPPLRSSRRDGDGLRLFAAAGRCERPKIQTSLEKAKRVVEEAGRLDGEIRKTDENASAGGSRVDYCRPGRTAQLDRTEQVRERLGASARPLPGQQMIPGLYNVPILEQGQGLSNRKAASGSGRRSAQAGGG